MSINTQTHSPIFVESIEDGYEHAFPQILNITSPILVISGASGAGKSTLTNMLSKKFGLGRLRNFTTRAKRPNEDESKTICIDEYQFTLWSEMGQIFTYNIWQANNKKYGLLTDEVETPPSGLQNRIYETTWFGNLLKSQNPDMVLNIWLIQEDREEMFRRMMSRATEPTPEIMKRLAATMIDQQYILDNQEQFLAEGKVDYLLHAGNLSPEQTMSRLSDYLADRNFIFGDAATA